MKVPCPSCQKELELADSLAGKLTRCPACQQSFAVPKLAQQAASTQAEPPISSAVPDDNDLSLVTPNFDGDAVPAAPPEALRLEACPHCGTAWKKEQTVCRKCGFSPMSNRCVITHDEKGYRSRVDYHKMVIGVLVLGVIVGIFALYQYWPAIDRKIRGLVNEPSTTEIPPETTPTQPKRKLSRD